MSKTCRFPEVQVAMNVSPRSPGMNRRQFLAATGLVLAAPTIIPASALGQGDKAAPSERITLGVVGWGMQGPSNTRAFLQLNDCQVVAACDLDKNHLQAAVNTVNKHYENEDCRAYHDFREMMARKDIDAVMLAVPDTWHALIAVEAANNKKTFTAKNHLRGPSPNSRPLSGPSSKTAASGKPVRGSVRRGPSDAPPKSSATI